MIMLCILLEIIEQLKRHIRQADLEKQGIDDTYILEDNNGVLSNFNENKSTDDFNDDAIVTIEDVIDSTQNIMNQINKTTY